MSRTFTLTQEQLEAAALLAGGKTQQETAMQLGVTRQTIYRWNTSAEFKGEVDRRKQKAIAVHKEAADRMQATDVEAFYTDLKKYRENLINIHRTQISLGGNILRKMSERFRDLPAESFTPKDLPGMFNVANNLLQDGFEGWAELIGLDEVLRRLEHDTESE